MAQAPDQSLPKATDHWADLKAAYRFLDNSKVQPHHIGQPHRQNTVKACAQRAMVLCVHDGTDFAGVSVPGNTFVMQSALAVDLDGTLLGMIAQSWYERVHVPDGETRQQRAQRWRESDSWLEAVTAIGTPPPNCRMLHVADRAADDLRFMHACVNVPGKQCGFVVRAQSNRRLDDQVCPLWEHLKNQAICGTMTIRVGEQRDDKGRITRRDREATVVVRHATVNLAKPQNHPGCGDGLCVRAVHLCEVDAPADGLAVDWMLLTSESIKDFADARQIISHYQHRWVIEEWHRALKEGCRLKHSQLHDVMRLKRLASVLSVVAVRLLQLRDLADVGRHGPQAENAQVLERTVDRLWVLIVAALAKVPAQTLTPRQFWETIARRGGWIGRKSDGRPGWKTIWRGWADIITMVQGAQITQQANHDPRCG